MSKPKILEKIIQEVSEHLPPNLKPSQPIRIHDQRPLTGEELDMIKQITAEVYYTGPINKLYDAWQEDSQE